MTSETKHTILAVEDLSIGYAKKKHSEVVSRSIKFNLEGGALVSLVGANGIGKSTLLRTLAGMQKSLGGTILIDGHSSTSYHSLALAAKLSVVLTEAPSSKNLSVREFVSLGRQPHTNWMGRLTVKDKEMIQTAMEQTDVVSLRERRCYELSDGQMQRVAIARAIAQDTPLIFLDEPTTHLDLYHRAAVLKLLKKLTAETGKTILFSTHEIDLAIQLSDQIILMTKEQVVMASPNELIEAGHFDALFPEDTLFFDSSTGRFTIKS